MSTTIQASEVNKALKDLDKEIKSVTGVINIQTIYSYIKQQNSIILNSKPVHCCNGEPCVDEGCTAQESIAQK